MTALVEDLTRSIEGRIHDALNRVDGNGSPLARFAARTSALHDEIEAAHAKLSEQRARGHNASALRDAAQADAAKIVDRLLEVLSPAAHFLSSERASLKFSPERPVLLHDVRRSIPVDGLDALGQADLAARISAERAELLHLADQQDAAALTTRLREAASTGDALVLYSFDSLPRTARGRVEAAMLQDGDDLIEGVSPGASLRRAFYRSTQPAEAQRAEDLNSSVQHVYNRARAVAEQLSKRLALGPGDMGLDRILRGVDKLGFDDGRGWNV